MMNEDEVVAEQPLALTADKVLCRRIWTSFGFGTEFLNFLYPREQNELQAINQYSYTTFVARVKTKINLNTPALFSLWFNYEDSELKDAIVKVSQDLRLQLYTQRAKDPQDDIDDAGS